MSLYLGFFQSEFLVHWKVVREQVLHLQWGSYFYALIVISLAFWLWEIAFPWRKKQAIFRKDFWLDAFYMFFNMFIFPLLGFQAASITLGKIISDLSGNPDLSIFKMGSLPFAVQLAVYFLIRDFIHWNVHRLLHRINILWEIHKVHHSVEQMGFAAHLRYHWAENIFYRLGESIPLPFFGFTIPEFFTIHILALIIGHASHANISFSPGPLSYIFNNPQLHIWHHARDLPEKYAYGVNFAISLSLWDYLFRTVWLPKNGRDEPLGFEKLEDFPRTFLRQSMIPLSGSRGKKGNILSLGRD